MKEMERQFKQGGRILGKRDGLISNQLEVIKGNNREWNAVLRSDFSEADFVLPPGSLDWNGLKKGEPILFLKEELE